MNVICRTVTVLLTGLLAFAPLEAQQPAPAAGQQPPVIQPEVSGAPAQATPPAQAPAPVRPNYVLGPNDQLLISVAEAEELNNRPFRVDSEGNVTLPLVGVIKAAGLTIEQFEAELTKQLRTYIRNPQVTVTVAQYRQDPIFVTGSFQKPGIYSLQGQRTLLEMLSTVGGLQSNTTRRIRITRRIDQGPIPLPNAIEDPDAKVSTVEIGMSRLMESTNPVENIVLQPYDVLYAARAEMVFLNVAGSKAGAFPVDERESLSVLQLLSLAGGLPPNTRPEKARILRPVLSTSRRADIPLDVRSILEGKANDYPLMPNDVLMIPSGGTVGPAMRRVSGLLVTSAVTSIIWVLIRNN